MKRVKLEIKLLMGSQVVGLFSTEARCDIYSDIHPLFTTIKKELDKWEKSMSKEMSKE